MPTSFTWTLIPPVVPTPTPPGPIPAPSGAFGSVAYTRQLKSLLPPGPAWNLEPGSTISKLLEGVADELTRINGRGLDLVNESDPRTATETLGDWEGMLSLPDELVPTLPVTDAGRRVVITQKLAARGGQSAAYFAELCAACGYPLNAITLFAVLRTGCRVGDRCFDQVYAYTMQLDIGIAAGAMAEADFERVIRARTHAHILVQFVYAP